MEEAALFAEPLMMCHFASGVGDPKYGPVSDMDSITKILNEALDSYNEINAAMNLVLFGDAILNILRIKYVLPSYSLFGCFERITIGITLFG